MALKAREGVAGLAREQLASQTLLIDALDQELLGRLRGGAPRGADAGPKEAVEEQRRTVQDRIVESKALIASQEKREISEELNRLLFNTLL